MEAGLGELLGLEEAGIESDLDSDEFANPLSREDSEEVFAREVAQAKALDEAREAADDLRAKRRESLQHEQRSHDDEFTRRAREAMQIVQTTRP